MFIIEDEMHSEIQKGEYKTFEEAFNELERRANIPWDESPNRCPCTNWKNCERIYHIIEYDDSQIYWKEVNRWHILTISADGVIWEEEE